MENLISTNMSVSQLIQNFEVGDIAVPEIQRDVVWKPEQIKQLIDSINQGFPCGSLILWEPREKDHSLVRSIMRPERLDTQNGRLPRYFLLDGQQRVTALASVILRKEKLKELLAEIEEEIAFIFINLKRFPREMEATTDIAITSSHGCYTTACLMAQFKTIPTSGLYLRKITIKSRDTSKKFGITSSQYRSFETGITQPLVKYLPE